VLYKIVRLVHPVLGLTTAQPPQHQQNKGQSFTDHIKKIMDYFQSELCSGCTYLINERVILILRRLHPIWCDALQRKYTMLVPQEGIISPIPMACQLDMLGVTLTQWCVEERLELPSAKTTCLGSSLFAVGNTHPTDDDAVTMFDDMHLDVASTPSTFSIGHTDIYDETVD
jgi:hypothetical protein